MSQSEKSSPTLCSLKCANLKASEEVLFVACCVLQQLGFKWNVLLKSGRSAVSSCFNSTEDAMKEHPDWTAVCSQVRIFGTVSEACLKGLNRGFSDGAVRCLTCHSHWFL